MDMNLVILTGSRHRCTALVWRAQDEWSDAVKFYAPLSGSAWIEVDGRRSTLRSGSCYLIPPNHRLSFGTRAGMVKHWLHFVPVSPVLNAQLSALKEVCCLPVQFTEHWRQVTTELPNYFRSPSLPLSCSIQAMLIEAIGVALKDAPPLNPGSARFAPALRFMEAHITKPVTLAEIASTMNICPEHFHRLFRKQFGTTPVDYLLLRRFALARQLLAEGTLSVKEVGVACGYEDPNHFSRIFHKRYGCSPRDFRMGSALTT